MTEPAPILTKIGEVRPSALAMNLAAIPLAVLCIGGLVVLARALPGYRAEGTADPWLALAGIAVLLVLHELTHAVAWKFRTRLPWAEFKFGFNPKALMFYCHCRAPMTVAAYRWGALAPLTALGSLSVLALLAYPAGWLAFTTGVHLAACIGDIWIVAGLRKFAPDALVRDHPTDAGCEVFMPPAMG
jgi:hypothetical protein